MLSPSEEPVCHRSWDRAGLAPNEVWTALIWSPFSPPVWQWTQAPKNFLESSALIISLQCFGLSRSFYCLNKCSVKAYFLPNTVQLKVNKMIYQQAWAVCCCRSDGLSSTVPRRTSWCSDSQTWSQCSYRSLYWGESASSPQWKKESQSTKIIFFITCPRTRCPWSPCQAVPEWLMLRLALL